MNLNKVFLIGRLTKDVELRATPSGQPVASFGVATNRVWIDKAGQRQEEVEYHNIVVWGRQAELANQYLAKGRLVMIEGRLRTRGWETQTGDKRQRTEIIAERIQFGPKSIQPQEKLGLEETQEPIPEIKLDEGGGPIEPPLQEELQEETPF
ncbi:MAG: single-stranded DNA-binding protein [Candidatus Paceibacteria bacterium]